MECEVEDCTYTLAELSDKAKARARDKFREHHLTWDGWDFTYDDAVTVAHELGLEIGQYAYTTQRGNNPPQMRYKPDIWFSGFSSQGDGCCWSGHVHATRLAGAVERVQKSHPCDDELLELARVAEQLHAEIAGIAAFNRLCGDYDNRDWPEVTLDMQLNVEGTERSYTTRINAMDVPEALEETANALVSGFADWIYNQLEAEYDYQMADEQIDEAIQNANLSFDEHGNEL